MTVGLLISVVPEKGNPFVMIVTDSKSTYLDGSPYDEKAKKIFDVGNALMATSGSALDEYRNYLAKELIKHQEKSLLEKIQIVHNMNIESQEEDDDLNIIVGLVQIDEIGNPQIALSAVRKERGNEIVCPEPLDKNIPFVNHYYFGEDRTPEIEKLRDELTNRFIKKEVNKTNIEKAATWFIREVAQIYPQSVNSIIQSAIKRAK